MTIKVLGYCEYDTDVLLEKLLISDYRSILSSRGEFTIIFEQDRTLIVITSYVGAMHYFYYYDGNNFSHSQHIIDIAHEQNLQWEWDWESVGDLCELENLTGNRTLHAKIKRVPPGSILRYDEDLIIHSTSFLDTLRVSSTDAVDAVEIFNEETSMWVNKDPFLSLSGGFDSRVILSSMLKQQIYPKIVTLGNEHATDVQVSKQIANRFALEHRVVQLSINDFFDNAERISFITNGSKPACHWHTYMYPKKAGLNKESEFFVGTLGEFARCYYFDKGMMSLLLDGFSEGSQEIFWVLKLRRHRTFTESEFDLLSDEFRKVIDDDAVKKRAERNVRYAKGEFLSGGSRYYLEQRVPNFYANGIRMYNDSTNWRSPFHNLEWLRTISGLNENWKLGSNWHRLAISRNYPELFDFPEEKGFHKKRMLAKAPPLYWIPQMQRMKYVSYDLSQNWYTSKAIKEFVLDNAEEISELINKDLCESIINEHRVNQNRTRAMSFILTMIYFKLAIRRGK